MYVSAKHRYDDTLLFFMSQLHVSIGNIFKVMLRQPWVYSLIRIRRKKHIKNISFCRQGILKYLSSSFTLLKVKTQSWTAVIGFFESIACNSTQPKRQNKCQLKMFLQKPQISSNWILLCVATLHLLMVCFGFGARNTWRWSDFELKTVGFGSHKNIWKGQEVSFKNTQFWYNKKGWK